MIRNRPAQKVTTISCAVPLCFIASGSAHGQVLETSRFNHTTTELVSRYAPSLALPDADEDGAITDADFLEWFITALPSVAQRRGIDLLNVEPCEAFVPVIQDALMGLAGDVNASGSIDAQDGALIIQIMAGNHGVVAQFAQTPSTGDFNGDFAVDADDLAYVYEGVGQSVADEAAAVTQHLLEELAGCGGPPSGGHAASDGPFRPDQHNYYISETYQPEADHLILTSEWQNIPSRFPKNHHKSVSDEWPAEGDHNSHLSKIFPPNHRYRYSDGWPTQPNVHSVSASRQWPPTHYAGASQTWYPAIMPPSQHLPDVSRMWEPGHLADISKAPLEHDGTLSTTTRFRSPHFIDYSQTWNPQHDTAFSHRAFPPNHDGLMSGYNPGIHRFEISAVWPAGHFPVLSKQWHPNEDNFQSDHYRHYPPNHDKSFSGTWAPFDMPPFDSPLPDDHRFDLSAQNPDPPPPNEE